MNMAVLPLKFLRTIVTLYENAKSSDPLLPTWGKESALAYQNKCVEN